MATWTNVGDTFLEPGKPVRSVDGLALRDNPIAIAEGATGAPRITNNAIANAALGAEKFQSGTDERDWVLARNASASAGAVGTYAMLWNDTTTTYSQGNTAAGSNFRYASAGGPLNLINVPTGTWRCMGVTRGSGNPNSERTTLWLRIS